MDYNTLFKNIASGTSGFSPHYPFLYNLVLGMEAKNVLELGAGFSTPTILTALEQTGGKLITCDQRSLEGTGNSRELEKQYPTWKYLEGQTKDTLSQIQNEKFDVVLHDGSHEWRVVYKDLRKILPRIKQDGILLVHDTEHIPTFHLKLAVFLSLLGYRHEKVTLPYGYGLTVIRILGNRKNGKVALSWKKDRK